MRSDSCITLHGLGSILLQRIGNCQRLVKAALSFQRVYDIVLHPDKQVAGAFGVRGGLLDEDTFYVPPDVYFAYGFGSGFDELGKYHRMTSVGFCLKK